MGGATNYITPIAVYDPNNISNFLDFSSGKFDFRGGDGDFRKSLHVRGNITASGVVSASAGIITSNFLVPGSGSIKIGDNSTTITSDFIKTRTLTSTDGTLTTDEPGFIQYNGDADQGNTRLKLFHVNDENFSPESKVQIEIDGENAIDFLQHETKFKGKVFLLDSDGTVEPSPNGNMIPLVDVATSTDKILILDDTTGQVKYRRVNSITSSPSESTGFATASIVSPIVDAYGTNPIYGISSSNLQFDFEGGLSGRYGDYGGQFNYGPIIIGTSSLFTASQAVSASYAESSSFTTTASFANNALSSSYAITASYALNVTPTPTPGLNDVLTVNSNAAQNIYLNGNNKIVLGTTLAENANPSSINFDGVDLNIFSARHIFLDAGINVGVGTDSPTEKLDIGDNLRVRGAISASDIPVVAGENTVVLWNGHKLVSNEFSTLLDANTVNSFATASLGSAGEVVATSTTSSFQLGFASGLSGSVQSNILTIETSSLFTASYATFAISSSYILADNIDQPFSNLNVTNDITASLISASAGITSSDVHIDHWGSVSASLSAAVNSNDNLGNHTASVDLNMNTNSIFNVVHITSSGIISSSGGFIGNLTGDVVGNLTGIATTASYVETSQTASFVTGSNVYGPFGSNSILSASYAVSASHAEFADISLTATTASHALNANTSITASYVATASYVTGSDVYGPFGSNSILSASHAENSDTALTATLATTALTASFVTGSNVYGPFGSNSILSASYAVSASHAEFADISLTATTATTASYVESASYIPNLQVVTNQGNSTTNSITGSGGLEITGSTKFKVLSQDGFKILNLSDAATSEKFALVIDNNGVVKKAATEFGAGSGASGNFIFHITASGTPSGPFSVIESGSIVLSGSQYIDVTAPSSGQLLFGINSSLISSISGAIDAATESIVTNVSALQDSASAGFRLEDTDSGFSLQSFETASFSAGGGSGLSVNVNSNNIIYTLNNILSSSQQIATDISGAFNAPSASFATDINNLQTASSSFASNIINLESSASAGIFFANSDDPGFSIPLMGTASFIASGSAYENEFFDVIVNNSEVIYELNFPNNLLSSSQQIATDISGAISAATSSILNDYGLVSGSVDVNQNAYSTASIHGTDLELIASSTVDNLIFQAGTGIHITTSSAGGGAILITGSGADNLGNHIATQTLQMGDGSTNFDIQNVKDMTVHGNIELQGENRISFDADSTNTYIAANSDNPEDIEIHADGDILLKPDSNVGIGIATTSPSEKLEVGGNVRGTTFISTGGSSATPAFRFSADTDTGLYLAQPGILALQIGPSGTGEFSLSETSAVLNVNTFVSGNITASGDISASGLLYASASNSNGNYNHVVVYDTGSGRFYYTGSYNTGTTSTGTGDANVLSLTNNTSNVASIGTVTVDNTHSYLRAEFYGKSSGGNIQAARTVFVWNNVNGPISIATVEDIRTADSTNLYNINSVSGSWDSNGNIQVSLTQYNGLDIDYKFRYILI
ncbi:hypothetical protein OAA40_00430 [bacterium]|nr:hypothetical protein [bacterium]